MSLIQTIHCENEPSWLASNSCKRVKTATAFKSMGKKDADTEKYHVVSGSIYPANDSTAEGIVYQTVDVTKGDIPCSVMTSGYVFENRLPETVSSEAKAALAAKGIRFEAAPEFERTY